MLSLSPTFLSAIISNIKTIWLKTMKLITQTHSSKSGPINLMTASLKSQERKKKYMLSVILFFFFFKENSYSCIQTCPELETGKLSCQVCKN